MDRFLGKKVRILSKKRTDKKIIYTDSKDKGEKLSRGYIF